MTSPEGFSFSRVTRRRKRWLGLLHPSGVLDHLLHVGLRRGWRDQTQGEHQGAGCHRPTIAASGPWNHARKGVSSAVMGAFRKHPAGIPGAAFMSEAARYSSPVLVLLAAGLLSSFVLPAYAAGTDS